jgi:hypothetical protein
MPTAKPAAVDWSATPAQRPVRLMPLAQIRDWLAQALQQRDGLRAAHCIHELWMRGDFSQIVESAMETVWSVAAESIPDWLPMQYVEWLPLAYEVAARFERERRGRSNLYFVLLDYRDSPPESRGDPAGSAYGSGFGIYVGMSRYPPAQRFDQHKAGIRSAGVVLKRGLEVLTGPSQHLQGMTRAQAADVEVALGEALRDAGLFVKGGH